MNKRSEKNKYVVILDTHIDFEKEYRIGLKKIFGFSFHKLIHLNKIFGVNIRQKVYLNKLDFLEQNPVSIIQSYLSCLTVYGGDLMKKISDNIDKFFSFRCYKRNRYLLGYPVNGQRTRTNGRTAKRLRMRY